MKRIIFFVLFFLIANILSAQQKPNIIYVLVDDLGYGDLGVLFQNQRILKNNHLPSLKTPQLDKMAAAGAILTQQYSNAPVCASSRASLLTGVNQGNAIVRDNQFDKALENNHTMATVLKQAGYATIAIGKWGLQGTDEKQKPNWPAHPLKRGFDEYFGYMRHTDGHEHYPAEGIYRGKKEVWWNYEEVSSGLAKCYTTDLWTAKAKDWIINHEKKSNTEIPFFMYLAYDAPHAVLESPAQAYPNGGGIDGGMKWIGKNGRMINTTSGMPDRYIHPDYANATYDDDDDPSTPNVPWPDTYKRYATAVRRLDDAVGDLLKLLNDLNIADNTLVVFSSDNGPSIESYLPEKYVPNHPTFFSSYGPFDGIKRDCWEGGMRMPSLAIWKNHIQSGTIVTKPCMLSDWLATFADAANTNIPARSDGVSLLPALTGNGNQSEGLVYAEYFEQGNTPDFAAFEPNHRNRKRNQMQMIRAGNFVGVRYDIKSANDDFEIYDVVNDPKEVTDLGKNADFAMMQKQMKATCLQARSTDDEAKRPYDSAAIPSINLNADLKNGFKWSFFPGKFSYVPSTYKLKEKSNGAASSLDDKETEMGLLVYTTNIKIPKSGKYIFSLKTNSKAFVRLHEAHLLDADFNYTSDSLIQKEVVLEKGFHPLKIYYLKNDNPSKLVLKWKPENGEWRELKKEDCYY